VDYFERDGAYFRRHSSIPGTPVNEVWWPNTGWVPYRRDPVGLSWFGNQIDLFELLAELEAVASFRAAGLSAIGH
jgi:hypothetical protein